MSESRTNRDEHGKEASTGPIRRGFSRARFWFAGLLVAALGAVIRQLATGGLTTLGSTLRDEVTGTSAPITVSVSPPHSGGGFYFERPSSALGATPSRQDGEPAWDAWAKAQGGLDAHETVVEVVIQGKASSKVILNAMDIRVLERRPPPAGTFLEPMGAGGAPARYFDVDLDEQVPRPVFNFGESSGRQERAVDFPYEVSDTDPEVFIIYADTARCDCTWIAELRWTAGERRGTAVIDDDGRPFRTVSGLAATRYRVVDGALARSDGT